MKLPNRLTLKKPAPAGFTLVEIIIGMALLAILFAAALPIGINFYRDYQLNSEFNQLAVFLESARNFSMINRNESDHGLYIDANNFIIFQGSSYATRVIAQDRVFPRSGAITITGPGELVFKSLSGRTASSTYVVSDGFQGFLVGVNEEGLVSF